MGVYYINNRMLQKKAFRSFLTDVSLKDRELCVLVQEKLVSVVHVLDVINDLTGKWATTFQTKTIHESRGNRSSYNS